MKTKNVNFKDKEIEQFISILVKYKEKVSKTEETSKKFLVDLGLITEKGNLKKNYKNICTEPHITHNIDIGAEYVTEEQKKYS